MIAPWKKSYDQPRQHIKKQRHYFANKGPCSQSYSFSSTYVWMWELNCKESWAPKNWCLWTVVLENTLESHLNCKEIKPVHPKGNQSWIFIGKTDAEAETPILWPHDAKNWLMEKILMLGKIEGRRRRKQQRMRWLDGITYLMDMSLLKLMSIKSVMPSNHFVLCCPLLLPSIFPSISAFSNESALQVAKVLELQLQHQSFQWIFRIDFL